MQTATPFQSSSGHARTHKVTPSSTGPILASLGGGEGIREKVTGSIPCYTGPVSLGGPQQRVLQGKNISTRYI